MKRAMSRTFLTHEDNFLTRSIKQLKSKLQTDEKEIE